MSHFCSELKDELQSFLKAELKCWDQRLRAELWAEVRDKVKEELQADFTSHLQAQVLNLRAQFERNLLAMREEFSAEIMAVNGNIMRLHKSIESLSTRQTQAVSTIPDTIVDGSPGNSEVEALLHLCLRWVNISELACTSVTSQEMLRLSDQAWKVWAVQMFNELEFRYDNSDWRSCLSRKVSEPKITLESLEQAFLQSGQTMWKGKPHWAQCTDCGYIYFVGESGSQAPLETAPCAGPRCNSIVGGRGHQATETFKPLSDRDAQAAVSAAASCVRSIEVNVKCAGVDACLLWVPKDCSASEVKAMIHRKLGTPPANQIIFKGVNEIRDADQLLGPADATNAVELDLVMTQAFLPGQRVRNIFQGWTGIVTSVDGLSHLFVQLESDMEPSKVHASEFEVLHAG